MVLICGPSNNHGYYIQYTYAGSWRVSLMMEYWSLHITSEDFSRSSDIKRMTSKESIRPSLYQPIDPCCSLKWQDQRTSIANFIQHDLDASREKVTFIHQQVPTGRPVEIMRRSTIRATKPKSKPGCYFRAEWSSSTRKIEDWDLRVQGSRVRIADVIICQVR